MIHFLIDTYDEMQEDIDNEKESQLIDEFSIIKTNITRIRLLFGIIERDFRVRKEDLLLESYHEII